jgi:3-phosphoglycerate kinase
MVFTFLKARGIAVGGSLVEDDKLDLARELEAKAKAKGVKLILPVDVIAADKFDANANTKVVAADAIPDGWLGLDQGPKSNDLFTQELRYEDDDDGDDDDDDDDEEGGDLTRERGREGERGLRSMPFFWCACLRPRRPRPPDSPRARPPLPAPLPHPPKTPPPPNPTPPKKIHAHSDCKTVIWNGPAGVFEFDKFAAGTFAIANTLASLTPKGTITIIGGGDSVAAVEKAGLADKMSHISTGGGASLELLEGRVLPGVAALNDK